MNFEEKLFAQNKKFNELVQNTYPEFFGKRFDGTWPFEGWHPIIWNLLEDIRNFCKDNDIKNLKVLQVKEKFGGLRFYYAIDQDYDPIMDYIDNLVIKAEARCAETCEYCGNPGKIQGKYWLKCVCGDHVNIDWNTV